VAFEYEKVSSEKQILKAESKLNLKIPCLASEGNGIFWN
jgi:hypothetical protein